MTESMFAMSLRVGDTEESCRVISADVRSGDFHHRMSFMRGDRLDQALCPDLARTVREVLGDLASGQAVFSAPDRVIELPGLVLARMRVLSHVLADGTRKVTMRFMYFIGSIAAAFRRQDYVANPVAAQSNAVALAALEDICLPACDLAMLPDVSELPEGSRAALEERLRLMALRRDELYFHVELLKRFLCQDPAPLAAPAHSPALPHFGMQQAASA
ncbi:hypothetical protein [Pseudaestuariivita sp.]|uniref:hypothetical protein n=1 Tax=Pseudaestuariivita sp. TaxID=2211669 RepID=UPI004059CF84